MTHSPPGRLRHVQHLHQGKTQPFVQVLERATQLGKADVLKIVEMGGAYLGKHRCKDPSTPIRPGISIAAYWRWPIVVEPIPFDPHWIVADDRQLLIANKPRGLPTQGRRDADYMAFYELLKNHLPGYLGLHHRLDQDTSGLMVYTRNPALNSTVSQCFQERLIQKRYLAVCEHWPSEERDVWVDAPLGPKSFKTGTLQEVTPKGKPAQTQLRLLGQAKGFSLVEAIPVTGRTHQIRVHLAHIGAPLPGDQLYGGSRVLPYFLLHCWNLAWPQRGRLKAGKYEILPPSDWHQRIPKELFASLDLETGESC